MNIIEIPDANINLAETQDEFITLPARAHYVTVGCNDGDVSEVPCFDTAWVPTAEELEQLNAGGYIVLSVLGHKHPPVMMNTRLPSPPPKTADGG